MPRRDSAAPRFSTVVVFPTPPFWLKIARRVYPPGWITVLRYCRDSGNPLSHTAAPRRPCGDRGAADERRARQAALQARMAAAVFFAGMVWLT